VGTAGRTENICLSLFVGTAGMGEKLLSFFCLFLFSVFMISSIIESLSKLVCSVGRVENCVFFLNEGNWFWNVFNWGFEENVFLFFSAN
jgi:hypothetical protein